MNYRIKKKVKKRLGYFHYRDYREELRRRIRRFREWCGSGFPIGIVRSLTISKGCDTPVCPINVNELKTTSPLTFAPVTYSEFENAMKGTTNNELQD